MANQPNTSNETLRNMLEVLGKAGTAVTTMLQKVETMKGVVAKGTASGDIFSDKRIGQIETCNEALHKLKSETSGLRQDLTTGPAVSGAPAGLTR